MSLMACSTSINDYSQQQPDFDLFDYFEGNTRVWGMVQDFRGKQIRRFEAEIIGTVTGNQLRLDEHFVYDDGELQTIIWNITRQENGHYIGTSTDVIGEATGIEVGNALHWQYTLQVQTQKGSINLKVNDWMYRQDEERLLNKTTLKKFGITVASTTLFFQKIED